MRNIEKRCKKSAAVLLHGGTADCQKTYRTESFGGKERVKGNRQGSLSCSITRSNAAVLLHGGAAVYSFGSLTASTSPLARPASPCSSDGMMIFVALPSAIFCMASSALSLMT